MGRKYDRVRSHIRAFFRNRRPRGTSALDHVNLFEHLLSEAEAHGLAISNVTKSTLLLETAGLPSWQSNAITTSTAPSD